MKKFLLTLIVTMLTCIGAWAQEERNLVGNTTTVFSSENGNLSDFCIQPGNAKVAQMSSGDKIVVYARRTDPNNNQFNLCPVINNSWYQWGYWCASEGWNRIEVDLDAAKLELIQSEGMQLFNPINTEFQRITFISESVPADVIATDLKFKPGTPTSVALGGTLDLKDYIDFGSVIPTEKSLNWASSNSDKIKVENGVVTGLVATDASEKVTITATTIDGSNLSATVDLIVKQGYSLTLAANLASVINNDTRTVTITPTVKVDETVQEASTYSITYSLVDNDDTKVTIDGNVVTVAKDATAGTVTVKAEVAENDTYAGTSATTTFTIENAPRIIWPELTLVGGVESMVVGSSEGTASPHIEVGNSNYVVDGNGNTVTPTSGITYEAEAIEGAEFVTILQNPTNEKWFHVTPVKVGQATIKITAKATYNGVEISDEQTAIVNVTPLKIQFKAADNLTVNDDQALTLAAIKAAVTKVYTEANSTQTELPSSDYEIEVYKDDVQVTEDIQAPHSANFTLTIKVKSKNSEYDDADPKNVTVTVTHLKSFTLALNGGNTSIMDNGQKAVITPAATYKVDENATPVPVEISSYDMTYTLSGTDVATVEKNADNTITVTGKNVGTVTVTVTAHPAQVGGEDVYANVTNTTTINVTESQKVYLTTETGADGKSYVVVNVPEGGAFGGISDTPKIDESKSTVDLTALKNAANVKVKGSIANSDVQELVNLIGGVTGAVGNCKILDMGEATMTERITSTEYKCSLVGGIDENGTQCSKSMLNAEKIVLPRPTTDNTIEGGTILPANTNALFSNWNNNATNEVTELVIPDGWTELADGCFGATEDVNHYQALAHLSTLTLPASIATLSPYVFRDCQELTFVDMSACENLTVIPVSAFENCYALEKVNFSPNLKVIDDKAFYHFRKISVLIFPNQLEEIHYGAFVNEEGNNSLRDVFFTGTEVTPRYVDPWAFTANTQNGNNTVADNGTLPDGSKAVAADGTITRYSYLNGTGVTCLLHYPAGYTAKYTDEFRKYNDGGRCTYTGTTLDVTNKSAFNYSAGWSDEFKNTITAAAAALPNDDGGKNYAQAFKVSDEDVTDANGNYIHNAMNGGYYDRTYGKDKVWPSQQEMMNGYAISHLGYLWNGEAMSKDQFDYETDPENPVDLRGLYQFIVAFDDAPSSPYYWDFGKKYENDKWYTICVPFNMTVDQIRNVFGADVQVCRFSSVTRDIYPENQEKSNKLVLEFRKSVMVPGGYGAGEIYSDVTTSTTGILHHVPYMIKPNGEVSTDEAYFGSDGSRRFPNYDRVGGSALYYDVISKGDVYYSFEGTFEQIDLPNNVYFLAANPANTDEHKFYYSSGATGHLNAYTASVRVRKTGNGQDIGSVDYVPFFTDKVINDNAPAPIFKSVFADDEDTNEIEKVVIVCGDDKVNDGKVYTIGGQHVNGNNLPAGLYIKNGKKFIVK